MPDVPAIRAEKLAKRFGRTVALDGLDLEVAAGTVCGVLGPNGAGKTTAVRTLATLVRPDSGRAFVGGHDVVTDPVGVRRVVGFTGQFAALDGELSGQENLVMIGRLLGLRRSDSRRRAAELLERFELGGLAGNRVNTYSGGTRRRLDLAVSLVGRPTVLFLDEPTTGLDPHARNQLWTLVRSLLDEGISVLLTTQYLDEADQLADRITVVDHGRVIAEGRPDELKRRVGGKTVQVRPSSPMDVGSVAQILADLTGSEPTVDLELGTLVAALSDPLLLSAVVRKLDAAAITVDELALRLPSLDDVFLALTRSEVAPAHGERGLV